MCDDLSLPYFIQLRAIEVVEDWQRDGMPASYPQTIASVALLRAYEECVTWSPRRGSSAEIANVQPLDVARISSIAGITEFTVAKHVKHPSLPWPTTVLTDGLKTLREKEQKITEAIEVAAKQRLSLWLAKPTGAARSWCRETRPRVLAACAVLRASRDAAGAAGDSIVVKQATDTALTPLDAAQAMGVVAADAANAVESALRALPSAA